MKTSKFYSLVLIAVLIVAGQTVAFAEPVETDVTVRALSKGAKFIGSSMDGARITIENAETGERLARGVTSGPTGSTKRIMLTKHGRNRVLSPPNSAKFTASLDLEKPTRIKITAYGPLSNPDDADTASVTRKILPGKDLTGGDGVLLEIPGFVVDVLSPTDNWLEDGADSVTITADVRMMCGCPITPDGLWDANDYEIKARVIDTSGTVETYSLEYGGTPSRFKGTIPLDLSECRKIRVDAFDPETGNTGYETLSCRIR